MTFTFRLIQLHVYGICMTSDRRNVRHPHYIRTGPGDWKKCLCVKLINEFELLPSISKVLWAPLMIVNFRPNFMHIIYHWIYIL